MLWVGYRTCRTVEVPPSDEWLAPEEMAVLSRLKIQKRRSDFRLGRFAAKRALSAAWARSGRPAPPAFTIVAADDGAPEAHFTDGAAAPFSLSISHSHAHAACVVAAVEHAELKLGCDLELIEPRSEELVRQFFTPSEQEGVLSLPRDEAPLIATLVWSAKEAALKAMRSGLRADTRSVEIEWTQASSTHEWQPLAASCTCGIDLTGYWRTLSAVEPGQPLRTWVLTFLSQPACSPPELLTD